MEVVIQDRQTYLLRDGVCETLDLVWPDVVERTIL